MCSFETGMATIITLSVFALFRSLRTLRSFALLRSFRSLRSLRSFALLRSFRSLRSLALLRSLRSLRTLALLRSFRSLGSVCLFRPTVYLWLFSALICIWPCRLFGFVCNINRLRPYLLRLLTVLDWLNANLLRLFSGLTMGTGRTIELNNI